MHENFPRNPKLWEGPHREASQMFMEAKAVTQINVGDVPEVPATDPGRIPT